MSADTEEGGEEAAPPADDEEEQPPIEEDERADVDLSELSDEIEEETAGEDGDDGGEGSDEADAESDGPPGVPDAEEPDASTETWGDQYVMLLAVVLEAVIEELAEDADHKTAGDIEALASQPPIRLDHHVDRAVEEMGKGPEVSPGKAVLLGSGLLVAVVLLTETDLASDSLGSLMEEVDL